MCKPISDEILYGDPDATLAADLEIEELLEGAAKDGFRGYDNPELCSECGEPKYLCRGHL